MDPAKMDLYNRVTEVLGSYDATPDQRRQILAGTGEAGSWDEVPEDVQKLITEIENSPRQSWDDPADLSDQQNL